MTCPDSNPMVCFFYLKKNIFGMNFYMCFIIHSKKWFGHEWMCKSRPLGQNHWVCQRIQMDSILQWHHIWPKFWISIYIQCHRVQACEENLRSRGSNLLKNLTKPPVSVPASFLILFGFSVHLNKNLKWVQFQTWSSSNYLWSNNSWPYFSLEIWIIGSQWSNLGLTDLELLLVCHMLAHLSWSFDYWITCNFI